MECCRIHVTKGSMKYFTFGGTGFQPVISTQARCLCHRVVNSQDRNEKYFMLRVIRLPYCFKNIRQQLPCTEGEMPDLEEKQDLTESEFLLFPDYSLLATSDFSCAFYEKSGIIQPTCMTMPFRYSDSGKFRVIGWSGACVSRSTTRASIHASMAAHATTR